MTTWVAPSKARQKRYKTPLLQLINLMVLFGPRGLHRVLAVLNLIQFLYPLPRQLPNTATPMIQYGSPYCGQCCTLWSSWNWWPTALGDHIIRKARHNATKHSGFSASAKVDTGDHQDKAQRWNPGSWHDTTDDTTRTSVKNPRQNTSEEMSFHQHSHHCKLGDKTCRKS